MPQLEGLAVLNAAGYKIVGGRGVNMCGTPARPKFTYIDLNGDGRPEAVATDNDMACFGGDQISVVWKRPDGRWAWLFRTDGRIAWLPGKTRGWHDAMVTTTCDTVWKYTGTTYSPVGSCAAPKPAASAAPMAKPAPSQYTGAFIAAGMVRKGGRWTGCDGETNAEIADGDIRDLNRDGTMEVIITESGSACFGNTGQGFHVMAQGAGGKWRKVVSNSGIPEFLKTSSGGWPDIEVGGPGFCFPVMRWNGTAYAVFRRQAKSPGGCNY